MNVESGGGAVADDRAAAALASAVATPRQLLRSRVCGRTTPPSQKCKVCVITWLATEARRPPHISKTHVWRSSAAIRGRDDRPP